MSGQKKGSLDVERDPERGARSLEGRQSKNVGAAESPTGSQKPVLKAAAPSARSQGVAQAARDRLAHSSYPALRALRLSFHEGVLTLRGRVPSYHMRQVAWKLVGDLPGVDEFVDRLEVVDKANDT